MSDSKLNTLVPLEASDDIFDENSANKSEAETIPLRSSFEQAEMEYLIAKKRLEIAALESNKPLSSLKLNLETVNVNSGVTSVTRGNLPRVELEFFNGDSKEYCRFMKQFKYHVEAKEPDNGQRLMYLNYYCRGKAKTAIQGCLLMDPEIGYWKAKKILYDQFGRAHKVIQEMLDDLISRGRAMDKSVETLTEFGIQLSYSRLAITELGGLGELDNYATIDRIARLFPMELRREWARYVDDNCTRVERPVTFEDLCEFVEREQRIANSRYGRLYTASSHPAARYKDVKPTRPVNNVNLGEIGATCSACHGPTHHLVLCKTFRSLPLPKRWSLAKSSKICFSCLNKGHRLGDCKRVNKCTHEGCPSRYHELLHQHEEIKEEKSCNANTGLRLVSLNVLPVIVTGPKGSCKTYALLDNGSEATIVQKDLIDSIGAERRPFQSCLSTITGMKKTTSEISSFEVKNLNDHDGAGIKNAIIVRSLNVSPSMKIEDFTRRYAHLEGLEFPRIGDDTVKLLIGADHPEVHWIQEQKIGRPGEPYATKTLLGWCVMGPLTTIAGNSKQYKCNATVVENFRALYNHEFSDLEDISPSNSIEDKRAIDAVESTLRMNKGQFEIALPWKHEPNNLPNNISQVKRRLMALKSRFNKDESFASRYKAEFNRHLALNHIEEVPFSSLSGEYKPRWYLPHHAVVNSKKPEKMRIVSDCAAQFAGFSLNTSLLQGPNIINRLIKILMAFRTGPIAIMADIEAMFMQVKVPERDRDAMRLLWWKDDVNQQIKEYRLTVHPFGAISSPFCANFALKQALAEYASEHDPEVAELSEYFYVDDLLLSVSNETEVAHIVPNVTQALGRCGFSLKKRVTNRPGILSEYVKGISDAESEVDKKSECRALGIIWNPSDDVFRFAFSLPDHLWTRRYILSVMSSVYDPLGFLAPVILPAKILLQDICRERLDWDTLLSAEHNARLKTWGRIMEGINSVDVRRYIRHDCGDIIPSLHIFCDASEVGYGAVAYARFENENNVKWSILFAKSRVAPFKVVSIPRLELNAAVMAVRMKNVIARYYGIEFAAYYYWCDSQIVLYYIHNSTSRFSRFVANRITTIHELSTPCQWRYIISGNNPADLSSRGAKSIEDLKAWHEGPNMSPIMGDPDNEEIRSLVEYKRKTTLAVKINDEVSFEDRWSRFESWTGILRAVAWTIRFSQYMLVMAGRRLNLSLKIGMLSIEELQEAELQFLKLLQMHHFKDEYAALIDPSRRNGVKKVSPLYRLRPFLKDGLIYVQGRMPEGVEGKHPIAIPSKHWIAERLIIHHHKLEGHCGVPHLQSSIRVRYWIIKGIPLMKKLVNKCWACKRLLARNVEKQMAPVCDFQITAGWHPFSYVGVEFFGPFVIKAGRKLEKRYGCLFSCLQIRAIHIECTSSMSSDDFILALNRFIARRGCLLEFYSDNGTNLVGSVNELKHVISKLSQDKLTKELIVRNIK